MKYLSVLASVSLLWGLTDAFRLYKPMHGTFKPQRTVRGLRQDSFKELTTGLLHSSNHHHCSPRLMAASDQGSTDPGQKSLPWILLTIIGRSTRWSVAGLVALGLLLRRDAKVMNFTGGAILNALFGKVLKRIIKEERPGGAVLDDHGMPSSHAMSLFFIASFLLNAMYQERPAWWPLEFPLSTALMLTYVVLASYWRISSGLHTAAQICVGALVGSIDGALWQKLCSTCLDSKVQNLLPSPQVPFAYVAGVLVVGAMAVGSVERKIGKLFNRVKKRES